MRVNKSVLVNTPALKALNSGPQSNCWPRSVVAGHKDFLGSTAERDRTAVLTGTRISGPLLCLDVARAASIPSRSYADHVGPYYQRRHRSRAKAGQCCLLRWLTI